MMGAIVTFLPRTAGKRALNAQGGVVSYVQAAEVYTQLFSEYWWFGLYIPS